MRLSRLCCKKENSAPASSDAELQTLVARKGNVTTPDNLKEYSVLPLSGHDRMTAAPVGQRNGKVHCLSPPGMKGW